MKKASLVPVISGSILLAAFALAGTGCSTPYDTRDLMEEEANSRNGSERPVAMRGEGTFIDGKVGAIATISRGFERVGGGRRADEGRRRRKEVPEDVYFGDTEEDQREAMEAYIRQINALKARGSPMPPVTLRVLVENKTTESMQVEVIEVNSSLGNFAVRPAQLTIPAGEQAMLQPMISQLGVTSDEIPLKLSVRAGGKQESQTITVKNVIVESLRK